MNARRIARLRESIRKLLFRLHLSVALAAGVFIVTMAATGVVLASEDAVMSIAERGRSVVVRGGTPRLPPEEIARAAEAWGARPGYPFAATSIEYRNRPGAAVRVHAGRERRVFVDPWTGEVVGAGFPLLEGFFEGMRGLHRWLGASGGGVRTGRRLTGAANLALLFLLLTGPLLWLPRRFTKRALVENLFFRRGLRGTARQLSWHYVVGIWSVVPLLVISVTGVVMSYPAVGDRVYPVVGAVVRGGGGGGEVRVSKAPWRRPGRGSRIGAASRSRSRDPATRGSAWRCAPGGPASRRRRSRSPSTGRPAPSRRWGRFATRRRAAAPRSSSATPTPGSTGDWPGRLWPGCARWPP